MDVKSTWISTWHKWITLHGHLDYFQNSPLGDRPNTKLRTMTLWTLTTVDLFYFNHRRRPTWIENHWNSIWLWAWLHMTSHYTWGSGSTLHDFGMSLDGLWTLSFGLSQFRGHGFWLVCEVALIPVSNSTSLTFNIYGSVVTGLSSSILSKNGKWQNSQM